MAYSFSGFFALCDEHVLYAVLERWPTCAGRMISQPFVGIGVSCGDEDGNAEGVKLGLSAFTTLFPTTDFVWIDAECFGGPCDYRGFVCRNGQIILSLDWPDDGDASEQALRRLFIFLGVEGTSFEPFERGYFTNS